MSRLIVHQDIRPVLFAVAILSALLASNSLLYGRSSPVFFFSIALSLAAAALRPTLHTAFASAAAAIFATVFFALDYIHGDCYYEVLVGRTWPRPGVQTDLEYHLRCIQSAQAWWLMAFLSGAWVIVFFYGLYQLHRREQSRIKLLEEAHSPMENSTAAAAYYAGQPNPYRDDPQDQGH